MTVITHEQADTVRQIAEKLQVFYEGLSEDEQAMCVLSVPEIEAGEEPDTQGFRIRETDERPQTLPEEPGGIHPYRINGPILYVIVTPTYRTEV
jgi:hypothetical protein